VIGVGPLVGSALAVGATMVPVLRSRSQQRTIDAARRQNLPELVDLFRLAVGAGHSVHQAIGIVTPRAPDAYSTTMQEISRRVSLGQRLGDAFDAFDELGDVVRPLAMALRSAAFDGVPLAPALDRVANDARLQRRRWAEANARRLPVQLLFPLLVCILPAFGLLAIAPLVLSALGSLQW